MNLASTIANVTVHRTLTLAFVAAGRETMNLRAGRKDASAQIEELMHAARMIPNHPGAQLALYADHHYRVMMDNAAQAAEIERKEGRV